MSTSMPTGSASAPATIERTFDWTQQLQTFLQGRLRTTPYRVAAKQSPLVTFPHAPLNTQYLIDGVVLAIGDHGDAVGRESYFAVVNHLRSCWGRWEQVRTYVQSMALPVGPSGDPAAAAGNNHRQYSYGVMAALQDLLLAWYVVDALLKASDVVADAARDVPQALSSALVRELPSMVASMVPLWCASSPSPYVAAALSEYRPRFEDMMVSWYTCRQRVVSSAGAGRRAVPNERMGDLLRRCEAQVKPKVRGEKAATAPVVDVPATSGEVEEETHGDASAGEHVGSDDLVALIRAAMGPAAPATRRTGTANDPAVGLDSGQALAATLHGKALVDVFIQQAFERSRTPLSCKHCGAQCADEGARVAHLRMHFLTHEQRDTDTAVRLRFPSLDDFLAHVPYTSPDAGAGAKVPLKLFCKTTEAHKPFFSAMVSVRRAADGASGGTDAAGSKKRPRSIEGVVVTDVATPYRCAECLEAIRPMQDAFSKEWVLPNCERRMDEAVEVVVHSGCRN